MFDIIRKLLSFMDRASRRRFFILLLPMLFTAVLEMVSIGMILPLLYALLGSGDSRILAWLPFFSVEDNHPDKIFLIAGGFAAFFVLKNITILIVIYINTKFIFKKMAVFQQRMFNLYMHRPYTFHLQRNTAEIIRNLLSSINSSFDGLRLVMNLSMDIFLTLGASLMVLIVEPGISLGIGLFLLILGFSFYRFFSPLLHTWGELTYLIEAKIIQSVNQCMGAIKDVKVLNCQNILNRDFADKTNKMSMYLTRSVTANQSPRFFIETLIVVSFLVVVLILIKLRGSAEAVIPTLGLFGMVALRLMPSMNRILSAMTEIKHRTAMVDSLYKDIQEGLIDRDAQEIIEGESAISLSREICLRDISYTYPSEVPGTPVLRGVDLTITKGESIGVVGPSGAGKTTLIDIFMGLLSPGEGKLLIDGIDAFANLPSWQSRLGYVPQQIYLLDDTLRRNVAFGIEDADISDDRLMEVICMAHLEDVVSDLPDGLDTVLGERGVRLSGGQRQRIGIARALYRDPEVLVFDEATSALDSETEREISQAVEELAGDKTLIIIAHRLSTVRKCNRLVFMKDGRIADIGGFDELMSRNPEFARVAEIGNVIASGPRS